MSPRKPHYDSLEDLYNELDHETLFDDEETALLDDDDLALIQTPKSAPAKKPVKKTPAKKAPAKKPKKRKRG
jgi:hypothetical protein